MTQHDELTRRIEAADGYLRESLRAYTRAVDLELLTIEAAVNVLLAAASLLAASQLGESNAAAFLEQRVASLAAEMRARQSPTH